MDARTNPGGRCVCVCGGGGGALLPALSLCRSSKYWTVYKFLLHNHFITETFFKKKSGDVNDEVNFPFFILLHKRAKPILPPSPSPPPIP